MFGGSDDVFREVANNSSQSVSVLLSMNKNMETLLKQFGAVPNSPPTAAPTAPINKETIEPVVTEQPSNKPEPSNVPTGKKDGKGFRRGKLFSSSVALGCNKRKLEYELNCKMEIIETYHIIENTTAPDPEKHLENMLKTHLTEDTDFIVIAVGSNDISRLNTEEEIGILNDKAIEHTKILVALAKEAAAKYDIDVFILERPPRYDRKDPKAVKSKLSQVSNGMLLPLINILEKVHLVKLPSLENLSGKNKKDLVKDDGIHLTYVGLTVIEDDMIAGIKNVFKDIKPKFNKNPPPLSPQHEHGGRDRKEEHRVHGGFGQRHYEHHDSRQQKYGGNNRDGQRHWNQRQEPGVQDMVRNFMTFMNAGPPNNRYRY